MRNLVSIINEENISEAKLDWTNIHDAIITLLRKYIGKPGISKEAIDYCNKVRDALNTIQH